MSSAHVHDLMAENRRLRRELTSHQVRLATYVHALNRFSKGEPVDVSHVTYVPSPGLVALARAMEEQRRVPAIRFVRDVRGQLTGSLELVVVLTDDAIDTGADDTFPGDMDLTAGDESC